MCACMEMLTSLTLTHGGIVMLRLHSTCCVSSYLVHFRRKDKNPVASLLLSLTYDGWSERRKDRARWRIWRKKMEEKEQTR